MVIFIIIVTIVLAIIVHVVKKGAKSYVMTEDINGKSVTIRFFHDKITFEELNLNVPLNKIITMKSENHSYSQGQGRYGSVTHSFSFSIEYFDIDNSINELILYTKSPFQFDEMNKAFKLYNWS